MSARVVHAVLPAAVDDPTRPSGGNVYDRRMCRGLARLGWQVHEHTVGNSCAPVVADLPDGSVVVVDGLLVPPSATALVAHATRLRLVVLVHMPLGPDAPAERAVLEAAAGVVATSRWARRRLLEWYALPPDLVHVAEPGTDRADLAPGTPAGTSLLSVGAVTSLKGYDVLDAALGMLDDLAWRCRGVGSLAIEATLPGRLRSRLELTGPLTGAELDKAYAEADLLVLASRAESYGMVVTEALAHGLPVVASDVGGIREALGRGRRGLPGVLVPPGDPVLLADALRRWLTDSDHRATLRAAALERRESLGSWHRTAALVAGALAEAAA